LSNLSEKGEIANAIDAMEQLVKTAYAFIS